MSTTGFAEDIPEKLTDYNVVSSKFNSEIKEGYCLVRGVVMDENDEPVWEGLVSNLSRDAFGHTDDNGEFKFLMPSKDTSIFFYHDQYEEIVIWNYNFQSQHEVIVKFYTRKTQMIRYEVEKPVIYIYNEEPTELTITVKPKGNLHFTYPEMNKEWFVKTNKDGSLANLSNQKNYPYLFWEGDQENLSFKQENGIYNGSLINKEELIPFLTSTLNEIGLNFKERSDFITYWAPKMMDKNYVFVQFLCDKAYESEIAELRIEPAPQSSKRVFMLFKGFDDDQIGFEYQPQVFQSMERKGLTLIEWGGANLNNCPLN